MRTANLLAALMVLALAGAAGAQTPASTAPVAQAKSAAAKVAARVSDENRKAEQGAAKAAPGPASSSPEAAPRPVAIRAGARKEAAASEQKAAKTITAQGKRDPFVSIIGSGPGEPPVCTTGKKCLMIQQLVVRGVAKNGNNMLALVENPQRRSYFLRVNEPVFNGEVIAITKDAVVFREKSVDRTGRVHMREVVKRVDGKTQDAKAPEKKPAR